MQLSYRYRFYPNQEVEDKITDAMGKCRFAYNKLLEMYRNKEVNTVYDACNMVARIKNDYPELKSVYSKVLQRTGNHLFSNISVLTELMKRGRKAGKLRFKSEYRYRRLDYNQSGFKFDRETGVLELSKIGSIGLTQHRELPEGKIKGIQIVKSKTDKYFAVFQISVPDNTVKTTGNAIVGIDMGVKTFCYDSDQNQFENPKYLAQSLRKVKYLQRSVSRKLHVNKKKITSNYIKDKKKLTELHEYVANQRNNRNHQVSRYYVNDYDIIAVEDLDILGMLKMNDYKKSKLSLKSRKTLKRNILDAGWRDFFDKLVYKAESAGKYLVKANPKNTTQKCSICRNIVKKDLKDRIHICPYCNAQLDRDYNASLNIKKEGMKLWLKGMEHAGLPAEQIVTTIPNNRLQTIRGETGSPAL